MWLPLFGYEELYKIDHHGNIKNKHGYVLKSRHDTKGYLSIGLTKNSIKKEWRVHRLVAFTFIDNPESLKEVNHINGVKDDNYVENLEWCTHSYNILHALATGLMKTPGINNYRFIANTKGENNPRAKLTIHKVLQIRELRSNGLKIKELAIQFSVSPRTIKAIVNKERWKDY